MTADLIERYLAWTLQKERPPTPETLRSYKRNLRDLERYCNEQVLQLGELSEDDLITYFATGRHAPGGTQAHRFASVRSFFKFLNATKKRTDNPTLNLRPPKRPPDLPRSRPGQLSAKLAKLSDSDRLIARFLQEFRGQNQRPTLVEVFAIKEEPPVGPSVTVRETRGRRRPSKLEARPEVSPHRRKSRSRARRAPPRSSILLQGLLESVLHTLSKREETIIQLRFGLLDGQPRTLEEVDREFHLTRERIRQIEAKTLSKLRHPSRSGGLRDYLE